MSARRRLAPQVRLWARGAQQHVRTARDFLRTAREAFGTDGEPHTPDHRAILGTVLAAKEQIRAATENMNGFASVDDYRRAHEFTADIYNAFDSVLLIANALKGTKLPSGEGITNCPIAGTLTIVLEALADLDARLGSAS